MASADSTIQYRDVPDFPGYRVGDDGSVWCRWVNCVRGRILRDTWKRMKPGTHRRGYLYVNLTPEGGGKYQTFRVHRLILTAFVGPCPEGLECRHLNGVRADNRLENLAWGTPAENYADRKEHRNYGPRVRLYTHKGQTLPLKEWAEHFDIPYACLWQRVNRLGMSFEEAVSRPVRRA